PTKTPTLGWSRTLFSTQAPSNPCRRPSRSSTPAPLLDSSTTPMRTGGLPTKKREKERKYLTQAQAKGDSFKPLVFETHGKIDKDVYNLLEMLASRTTFDRGLAVTDMKLDLAV